MYVKCVRLGSNEHNLDKNKLYNLNTNTWTGHNYIQYDSVQRLYIYKSIKDGMYYAPGHDYVFEEACKHTNEDNNVNECMIKDMPVKAQRIIAIKHGDEWRDIGFYFDRIESTEKTITLICTMRYRGYSGEMNIDSDVIVRWG